MKAGGFDAVIGNPPYVNAGTFVDLKDYFSRTYKTYSGNTDLYVYFVERSLGILNHQGLFGMIISNKWIRADYGEQFREYLSTQSDLRELVDFGELPVFRGVGTFPCIALLAPKREKPAYTCYAPVKVLPPLASIVDQVKTSGFLVDLRKPGMPWLLVPRHVDALVRRVEASGTPLGCIPSLLIRRGVLTGFNPAFIIDEQKKRELVRSNASSRDLIKPFVSGDETRRYSINWQGRYVIFTRRGIDIGRYPAILRHLATWRTELEPKKHATDKVGRKPGSYMWYEIQDSTSYYEEFEKPKLVYGQFQIAPHFCFSPDTLYFGSNHYMMVHHDSAFLIYLCGLLNSRLYFFIMKRIAGVLGDADDGGRLISQKSHILKFPVRVVGQRDTADKAQHDKMVSLVERMLRLHKDLPKARTAPDKTAIERQIAATDRQIDELVYELYCLTKDEIRVVEGTDAVGSRKP